MQNAQAPIQKIHTESSDHNYLLIVAGGQGTRLFPLSHESRPKQFCYVDKKRTFIQATVERYVGLGVVTPNRVIVITTNDNQERLTNKQLLKYGVLSQNIIQLAPKYDFAGCMIKGAEFIREIDPGALIINTPADQFIVSDEAFRVTMAKAIREGMNGHPTIVGVKITDMNTVVGCGHARYDVKEKGDCRRVLGFVEKPDKETADKIMRADDTACNTAIGVWKAEYIAGCAKSIDVEKEGGVKTDELMSAMLGELQVAIGWFSWYDCGTLKSLHEISDQTPNHKNASLGKGVVKRHKCQGSLFYAPDGYTVHASYIRNSAVVVNEIDGKTVVVVVDLGCSQSVSVLAKDFSQNGGFLTKDFSLDANNNTVLYTEIEDISAGFVGVSHHGVTSIKDDEGDITVDVSNNGHVLSSAHKAE